MVILADALNYLGIDYSDPAIEANVSRALETAKQHLKGAVGADLEEYLPDDARADSLVLAYVDELYSERAASSKNATALRAIIRNMEDELRLELRARKAGIV